MPLVSHGQMMQVLLLPTLPIVIELSLKVKDTSP